MECLILAISQSKLARSNILNFLQTHTHTHMRFTYSAERIFRGERRKTRDRGGNFLSPAPRGIQQRALSRSSYRVTRGIKNLNKKYCHCAKALICKRSQVLSLFFSLFFEARRAFFFTPLAGTFFFVRRRFARDFPSDMKFSGRELYLRENKAPSSPVCFIEEFLLFALRTRALNRCTRDSGHCVQPGVREDFNINYRDCERMQRYVRRGD